jgi:hypothetical protein
MLVNKENNNHELNGDLNEYLNAAEIMRQVKQSNCGDIIN